MKPILTIFTTPKPFTNPHISVIQRNAIRSWVELGEEVQVILLGDEAGTEEAAKELGAVYLPRVKRNSSGTPLLSSIFSSAREASTSLILAFANADMLLLPDFLESARQIDQLCQNYLVVGQRWDLNITDPLDFSPGWQDRLTDQCDQVGKLHKPTGSDYFIFPRSCFESIPDFAIGRAGWDNWMFYEARQRGWKLIDATRSIRVIHQNHDYSHLPGGQPHYHLPESDENVSLAGGKRHIFLLQDVNWKYENRVLSRPKSTWKRFWREVELLPLAHWHSERAANIFFVLFHPWKAYNEFRQMKKVKGNQE
ncbi:MAG: hypothetical protein AB9897_04880 [Anaerolineaceae bacterium]